MSRRGQRVRRRRETGVELGAELAGVAGAYDTTFAFDGGAAVTAPNGVATSRIFLAASAGALLDPKRPSNWYDLGEFWSGDRMELSGGDVRDTHADGEQQGARHPSDGVALILVR